MKKVLYLGADVGFQALREEISGRADTYHVEAAEASLLSAIEDADALLDASMKVPIASEILGKAQRLKIIACATTGADHIDREELARRSIKIRTLREDRDFLLNLTPAAEHSWALLMACARKLPSAHAHVISGEWIRESFPGVMLRGKRIGIIGCGRIGTWMGRYAMAFGMQVMGCDPYVDPLPDGFEEGSLLEVMEMNDFISIHVHLSDETEGMISRECFEHVKPGAIFINTSRGGLVDEEALLEALRGGRLGGAGLDVLQGEPDVRSNSLWAYARTHDNLILTPHCGGFSPDAVALVCAHTAKKIVEELDL
jgi:D-3-phosphoglycerate dehydrogenase